MPRVKGFLHIIKRRGPSGPIDPDYGIEEGNGGEGPEVEPPDGELPTPPPGIWPPLTPDQPWRPIDPGFGHGRPDRPSTGPVLPGRPVDPGYGVPDLPPGSIWPPLPPGVHGKYLALVLIGGGGHGAHYRYVVVDADALPKPEHPIAPGEPI